MAGITPALVAKLNKIQARLAKQQERTHIISDELWAALEPLVDQNDLALDLALEELLTVSSYAQFEIRVRIRHLRKLQNTDKEGG